MSSPHDYQDPRKNPAMAQMFAEAAEKARKEHEKRMAEHRRDVYAKHLPKSLLEARLSRFVARDSSDEAVLEKARAWREAALSSEPPNLSVFGPPGTGKSWLCAAIGWSLIHSEKMPRYLRATDAWSQIKSTYGNGEGSERSLMSEWMTYPILILDELGAGHITEPYRACIAEIVGQRTDNGLPTVVASNLAPASWASAMDDRAADRMAGGWQLAILGKSRRGQA